MRDRRVTLDSWEYCNKLIIFGQQLLAFIASGNNNYSINILYQKVKGTIKRVENNENVSLSNGTVINVTKKDLLPQDILIHLTLLVYKLKNSNHVDDKDIFKLVNDILTLKMLYIYLMYGIDFNKRFYRDLTTNNLNNYTTTIDICFKYLEKLLNSEHNLEIKLTKKGINITAVDNK